MATICKVDVLKKESKNLLHLKVMMLGKQSMEVDERMKIEHTLQMKKLAKGD